MQTEESKCPCIQRIIQNRNPGCYVEATKSYNDLLKEYEAKKQQKRSLHSQLEKSSDYLKRVLYPQLQPAMEKMIYRAMRKNAIVDQKQVFNPIDYLAEILWNKNPKYPDRRVRWKAAYFAFREKGCICHREVYPLHWILPREVAAVWIQARVRAYLVQKMPKIQEIRTFWKTVKEENWKMKKFTEEKEIEVPQRISPNFRYF